MTESFRSLNCICERFYQTILNKFNRVSFRKKIYGGLEVLQTDLDEYINHYKKERTHQGKGVRERRQCRFSLTARIIMPKNI
jgi:hypothetical protein